MYVFLSVSRHRLFPPKTRLLTEEEYIQQASIETKKALEQLQGFCQSPRCNAWKTITQLKSPMRFSEFVEGSSHLTDQELMSYDYEDHEPELDCDDISFISEDEL